MSITITDRNDNEVTLPTCKEVCWDCNGHGKRVAPGVDSHGITQEEFADDPEFAYDYFAGRYDIQCPTCKGQNVVDAIAWHMMDDELTEDANAHFQYEADARAEEDAERRAGC